MIIELNISDSAPDTASIKPTSSSSASSSGTGPTLLSEFELRRCVVRIRLDATTGQLSSQPILDSDDALLSWIHCLELAFNDSPIPQSQWSDAMILFLEGPVNMEMRKRRQARRELGWSIWNWEDFVASLREVVDEHNVPSTFQQFKEDHPNAAIAAKIAGTGLVVAGGAVLAPVAVVGGLNVLGFTATGVAGGSIAAGLQSALYGGATTGLFSICQSVAATVVAPAAISIISAAGSLTAGATLLSSGRSSAPSDDDDTAPPNGGVDGEEPQTPYSTANT